MLSSSRRLIKDWGSVALGIVLLASLTLFSIHILFMSLGFGKQPTLSPSDISQLSSYESKVILAEAPVITKPKRMLLPSVDLGLDIANSTIDIKTNEWPLSDTTAQYANFTPGLGNKKGTLLIYGHNSWAVMQRTNDLKLGDELVLVDTEDTSWRFKLVKQESIFPENVSFIYEDVAFRVVMFTCDGWNDQYRRLMYFEPVAS